MSDEYEQRTQYYLASFITKYSALITASSYNARGSSWRGWRCNVVDGADGGRGSSPKPTFHKREH